MSLVLLQLDTYCKEVKHYKQVNPNLSCSGDFHFLNFVACFSISVSAGSWDDVFKVAVALYIIGTLVWNFFSTGEKILD